MKTNEQKRIQLDELLERCYPINFFDRLNPYRYELRRQLDECIYETICAMGPKHCYMHRMVFLNTPLGSHPYLEFFESNGVDINEFKGYDVLVSIVSAVCNFKWRDAVDDAWCEDIFE